MANFANIQVDSAMLDSDEPKQKSSSLHPMATIKEDGSEES